MAKVHNPTPYSLWCDVLHQQIGGHRFVVTSDDLASRISPTIFRVELDAAKTERAQTPPATRTRAQRGAKQVEQSERPSTEMRANAVMPSTVWFAGDPSGGAGDAA